MKNIAKKNICIQENVSAEQQYIIVRKIALILDADKNVVFPLAILITRNVSVQKLDYIIFVIKNALLKMSLEVVDGLVDWILGIKENVNAFLMKMILILV